ncbi:MAG TPA: hypothetical protein GXX29_01725 [Firmicutes bacterium]|nr:hypothetical protein [Bacillota bacterium]
MNISLPLQFPHPYPFLISLPLPHQLPLSVARRLIQLCGLVAILVMAFAPVLLTSQAQAAAAAAGAEAPVDSGEANLLTNPGFEDVVNNDFPGWTRYVPMGNRNGLQISTDARSGKYSALVDVAAALKDSDSSVARLDWSQRLRYNMDLQVKPVPGEKYRFSVYYKTEGNPKGRLGVERRPHMTNVYLNLAPSPDWQYAAVEFEWPDAADWNLVFGLWAWEAREGKIWFDDARLEQVLPETEKAPVERVRWQDPAAVFSLPYTDASGLSRPYINQAKRLTFVQSLSELTAAIAAAMPGDTIILEDGEYYGYTSVIIEGKHGTEERPIVIAAKNIGQAVMRGSAQFIIKNSSYIVVEGLDFRLSSGGAPGYSGRRENSAVILHDALGARITRNRFALEEEYGGTSLRDWINVDGSRGGYNRIDHNLFENKVHNGSYIAVNADLGRNQGIDTTPRHTRIDHNHFRHMAPLGINGMEVIRLGSSGYRDMAHIEAHTIVEYNLFEQADGEKSEIISIKDSGNIIRYNTFLETAGSVVLRFGHHNSIYGNYFLGKGKPGTGGVRIYGFRQQIFNNYFADLAGPAIIFGRGSIEDPYALPKGELYYSGAEYVQMDEVEVVMNTFINNNANFDLRGDWPLEPRRTTVAHNLLVAGNNYNHIIGSSYRNLLSHDGIRWVGNMVSGPVNTLLGLSSSSEGSFIPVDLELMRSLDDIYYPVAGSPTIDAIEVGDAYGYVTRDIEGKLRDEHPDVGAFEYQGFPLVQGPLSPAEVGPFCPDERRELTFAEPLVTITSLQFTPHTSGTPVVLSGTSLLQLAGVVLGAGEADEKTSLSVDVTVSIDGAEFFSERVAVAGLTADTFAADAGFADGGFAGPGFSLEIPINTTNLDEGEHSLRLVAEVNGRRTLRELMFSVQNIEIMTPGARNVVTGKGIITIKSLLPAAEIRRVHISIDDQLIFQGEVIPDKLEFDSLSFSDGRRQLTVEVERHSGGISRISGNFKVENLWQTVDELLPPMQFFGQLLDRAQTSSRSDGWVYATEAADDFLGDDSRLTVGDGSTPQFLEWEAPNLLKAAVTVYSQEPLISPQAIEFALSPDGVTYKTIEFSISSVGRSSAGWNKYLLTAETQGQGQDSKLFRLTINPHGGEIQIGLVELTGLR